MLILTAIIAGAAIWSAWMVEGQFKTMEAQLQLTDRAWVKREATLNSGVEYLKDGSMYLKINFKLKNVGHAVANRVTVFADAFAMNTLPLQLPEDQLKKTCSDRPVIFEEQTMLFPDEQTDYSISVFIKREDLVRSVAQTHVGLPAGLTHPLDAYVVGCVVYQSPNYVNYLVTPFIYAVMKADPDDPMHKKNLPLTIGEPVPIGDVRLLVWDSGAVRAK
jgi:hypothetical protein